MNLSSFYNQVKEDHSNALKGLRTERKLPNYKDYKSIKAVSSNGITVFLYSSLGNATVETKYYIKDDDKRSVTKFKIFNNTIMILNSNIYKPFELTMYIKGFNWLSRTTFRHLNMIFNTYDLSNRVYTSKKVSYLDNQEITLDKEVYPVALAKA
mgnify:FL=1|tara:strand:- start:842 stop:1303 length:462 start_codon:yes stop_codon:yes gene_type:complete